MEFKTANGNKEVKINIGDLEEAFALQDAILNTLKDNGIDVSSLKDGMQTDISDLLPSVLGSGLGLLASKEVRANVFACLSRCTYNGERIKESTFNDLEAREDFYEVAMACVKVNCAPFLKSLLSAFSMVGMDKEKLQNILK